MKKLKNVTLLGIDCVNVERLINAVNICKKDFDFEEVKILTSLPSSHKNIVHIDPINSTQEYSEFVLKKLADYITTQHVFIVQHDGFILNPYAWSDKFLNYDYIGAPLCVEGQLVVGNGGFSIRSKKLLALTQSDSSIQLGNKDNHKYAENEDWIISVTQRDYLESVGIRFAPVELAHSFSMESNEIYGKKWSGEFGFHGLKWTDITDWIKKNPEWGIENPLRLK